MDDNLLRRLRSQARAQDRLRKGADGSAIAQLKDNIDNLQAECDALRTDAERYRWIRENSVSIEFFTSAEETINIMLAPNRSDMNVWRFWHSDLDKGIDEAMKLE